MSTTRSVRLRGALLGLVLGLLSGCSSESTPAACDGGPAGACGAADAGSVDGGSDASLPADAAASVDGSALVDASGSPDGAPPGKQIFIAQAAAGSSDGSSCADARSYAFFNDGASWGAGATQISPGTTVRLCGTITSDLTFQGDGAAGMPIVLDGTGATLAAHLEIDEQAYWTVQHVTWATTFPADGSTPLAVRGGSFGTIDANVLDVYQPAPALYLQQNSDATALSHDIVISNNFLRNSATNMEIQTDLLDTEGSYNVTIEGNYFEMRSQSDDQHDDCIQTYEKGEVSAGAPYNWTIRDNELVMNTTSTNNKSWLMIEQMGTGYINVYGNLYLGLQGASGANGIVFDSNGAGLVASIVGNTIVEKAGANGNLFNLSAPGTLNLADNLVYSTDSGNALTGAGPLHRDHNLWFGANTPSCLATELCAQDPLFQSYSTNDFSLQATSPARGAGANEGATYAAYPSTGATWPHPGTGTRAATGAWDIGAFD